MYSALATKCDSTINLGLHLKNINFDVLAYVVLMYPNYA